MKLIKPNVELIRTEGVQLVEEAARNCYRSVPRDGADAMQFADALYKAGHLAPLEFARYNISRMSLRSICEIMRMPPSEAVKELNAEVDGALKVDHSDYITLKITTSRQITHELVRHRRFSFAQESTRYCNYSKGKFGGEVAFIEPANTECVKNHTSEQALHLFSALKAAETAYLTAIDLGFSAQEAAMLLPNQTAAVIYMQGSRKSWEHFLDLRYFEKTGKVHPEMKYVATLIKEAIEQNG